ncbi:MAG TPA: PEGA domain-containing protein [Kofleriaceae bacterium]|nr:PEGA domain-containing protein [Kofleriaceae bacterium]
MLATVRVARADYVAVESYVGTRPSDAERVMKLLRPMLARAKFVSAPADLKGLFAEHAWQSSGSLSAGPRIAAGINSALNKFQNTDWAGTVKDLVQALALARANPIAWALEPRWHDQVRDAMIYLAISYGKLSKDERDAASLATSAKDHAAHDKLADEYATKRDAAMSDVIRTFPTLVIAKGTYGREAEELSLRIHHEIDAAGRGSLDFSVDLPEGKVFLDGAIQASPKLTVGDLIPGEHQLLVVDGSVGHEYPFEVFANQVSRRYVHWGLDSALVLTDWTGFQYGSATEQSQETALVSALAQSVNVKIAATITVGRVNGRPSVSATLYYAPRAQRVRICKSDMNDYTDEDALRTVVNCLVNVGASDSSKTSAQTVAVDPATADGSDDTAPEAAASVSVHSVPSGASIYLDGHLGAQNTDAVIPAQPGRHNVSVEKPGYVTEMRAIDVAAGHSSDVTVQLRPKAVATSADGTSALPWIIGSVGAAALVTGVVLYAVHQEPSPTGGRTYRDTATPGIVTGIAGVVTMSVAGFLWYHGRHNSSTPIAAVGRDSAIVGWAGAF